MMTDTLIYGTTSITYTIVPANRKTLAILVEPDGTVIAKVPSTVSLSEVKDKIHKRARWILRQLHYFKSFGERTPTRRYISGESHLYLGRQYLLRVSIGKPDSVKYKGRYFEIVCSDKSKAEKLMKEWYRQRAKIKFAEIAEPIILRFKKYNVEPSSIYIQEMNNRWGSCTKSKKIILNTELIKAPRPCIEYVITHELCHLIHPDHTKLFYDMLYSEMPDWKKWKDKLERFLM